MPIVRVGLAQINPSVGDLEGNSRLIREAASQARDLEVQLLVFPEMALTGYPVEDLSLRPSFQRASRAAMVKLANDLAHDGAGHLACLVGYLDYSDEPVSALGRPRGGAVNAAALIHDVKSSPAMTNTSCPITGSSTRLATSLRATVR